MVRLTTEQFIEKARAVHGDRYDYSKVVYVTARTKVEIICRAHGSFWQTPKNHKGSGCSRCGWGKQSLDEVLEAFKKTHGEHYDYSKVVYVNARTKVEIICKEHGSFWQTPNSHKSGAGCPTCGILLTARKLQQTLDGTLKAFRKTHGDHYAYSRVVYVRCHEKVEIICKEHGSFWQTPNSHKSGAGCPTCGILLTTRKLQQTLDGTLKGFKKTHGDRYDYSRVEYVSVLTKVEIVCEDHGSFWQTPSDHKSGHGCPNCAKGKSERLFGECLKELGYKASKIRPQWLRNPKTGYPLELDFYIPELKIAFEVQGRQHYEPVDCWGGEEAFQGVRERDQQKRNQCFMMGVILYEYDLRDGRDKAGMLHFLAELGIQFVTHSQLDT